MVLRRRYLQVYIPKPLPRLHLTICADSPGFFIFFIFIFFFGPAGVL
jgi:hypothetical protein